MAFYQTQNLANFGVSTHEQVVAEQINLTSASILEPNYYNNVAGNNVAWPAQALINGYVTRTGVIGADTLPSATSIIVALNEKFKSIKKQPAHPNGTSFVCAVYNDSVNTLYINSVDANVTVNGTIKALPGTVARFYVYIVSQVALGDAVDKVSIVGNCCDYYPNY